MRLLKVCSECHSDNISVDASAEWDPNLQKWVLAGLMDFAACNACGAEYIEILDKTV